MNIVIKYLKLKTNFFDKLEKIKKNKKFFLFIHTARFVCSNVCALICVN